MALPALVRQKALQAGEVGVAWLTGLPELIAELEQRWSITIGEALAGGTAAYVARARRLDGTDAVVKLSVPDPDFARQVRTIAAAEGRGYVLLLASDAARQAALLESLGPSLSQLGLPAETQMTTLCDMLRLAWAVPPPAAGDAEVAQNKAVALGQLVAGLSEQLGRPCPEQVIAQALTYAERRAAAFDPERCVVVHGDPAPPNALLAPVPRAGAEAGFVFVDPDGFLGDPAYDLGVVLRDRSAELLAGDAPALARRYCRLLAARSGIDESAIWEWGYLERVSTGLYVLALGAEELARPFLDSAEALSAATGSW